MNAGGQAAEAEGLELGLRDVEQQAGALTEEERVAMWVRASLNAAALGKRLQLILEHRALLATWYHR